MCVCSCGNAKENVKREKEKNLNGVCFGREVIWLLYGRSESCISTHLSMDHYAMIHSWKNIEKEPPSMAQAHTILEILHKFVSEFRKLCGIRRHFSVEKTFTSWSPVFIHCNMLLSLIFVAFYASIKHLD